MLMKMIIARIYFYLYKKAVERDKPETAMWKIIKEVVINIIRYYKK